MEIDQGNLRTALIITLSILLVAVLWRRFKRKVVATEMPAPLHAELIALEVEYHPARLHVVIHVPGEQVIRTRLLGAVHNALHEWEQSKVGQGEVKLQLLMPEVQDGTYHLEMSTATQRTVRQFRLMRG